MRLLCVLNGDPDHPSSRLRLLQHTDVLRARGIAVDLFVAKNRSTSDQADLARRARRSDAVLVQKKLFARWKLPLLLGPAPMLFDFDDAVFAASPYEIERGGEAHAERRAASRRRRLAAALRRSRRVIAGNAYLAEYASRYARDVAILPTGVDLRPFSAEALERARDARRRRRGTPLVGWVGSPSSLRYLPLIAEPLRRLFGEYPQGRFVQICSEFLAIPQVPFENVRWSVDGEAPALLGLDIGVMPLDDSSFSRGKCGLKILMYQAAGLPVVCSPVGANRDLVRDGESGFLAPDAGTWLEALRRLAADPETALRLGARGRDDAARGYEARVIGERLADIILGVASPGAAGAAA